MPTTAELALILRFRDEATAAMRTATRGFGESLVTVGKTVEEVGLQMRRVSRELLQVGVVITGAFTLAFVEAGKHIPAVRDALESFTHQVLAFQESIAKAALPVLTQLTALLDGLNKAFNALDASTRDFIIRATLVVGILALVSGTVGRLAADFLLITGRVITWIGAFAAFSPVLFGVTTAVLILVAAFGAWQPALTAVTRSMDVFGNLLKLIASTTLTLWVTLLDGIVHALEGLMHVVALVPGPFHHMAQEAEKSLDRVRVALDKGVAFAAGQVTESFKGMVDTAVHGGGTMESTANQIVKAIGTIKSAMAGAQVAAHDFFGKLSDNLSTFWTNFTNWSQQATALITGGINNLGSGFEKLYTGMMDGSIKAKDAFKDFGQVVIATIMQMIAKALAFMTVWIIIRSLMGIGSGISAAVGAAQGATTAVSAMSGIQTVSAPFHQGGIVPPGIQRFQTGGEVLAMVQPGEFVVNQQATANNRGLLDRINRGQPGAGVGDGMMNVQNVFIIQAIDAASFRGTLQQHADLIEAMFQRAMRRNSGPMREAVRT